MSMIETIEDVNNAFLSRREITCNFKGLAGKLQKLEAVDMVSKELKLEGKVIIPMKMENQVGRPIVTGTFYVYENEELAKKHVKPSIFTRIEKTKAKIAEKEAAASETPEEQPEQPKEEESKE